MVYLTASCELREKEELDKELKQSYFLSLGVPYYLTTHVKSE